MQHRFGGTGALAGHAVGNLLLVGAVELLGDPVAALDGSAGCSARAAGCCRCAASRWTSRPRSPAWTPSRPGARTRIRGQVAVAITPGRVRRVSAASRTTPPACPEAVAAVRAADWVVLGPGSWFTSVLPHLLVPELPTR